MQLHKLKSSFLARCFLRTLAFQNQWPGFYMSSALDRKMLLTCANIISSRDIGENIIYSDTYCFQSYPKTKWSTYCHMMTSSLYFSVFLIQQLWLKNKYLSNVITYVLLGKLWALIQLRPTVINWLLWKLYDFLGKFLSIEMFQIKVDENLNLHALYLTFLKSYS